MKKATLSILLALAGHSWAGPSAPAGDRSSDDRSLLAEAVVSHQRSQVNLFQANKGNLGLKLKESSEQTSLENAKAALNDILTKRENYLRTESFKKYQKGYFKVVDDPYLPSQQRHIIINGDREVKKERKLMNSVLKDIQKLLNEIVAAEKTQRKIMQTDAKGDILDRAHEKIKNRLTTLAEALKMKDGRTLVSNYAGLLGGSQKLTPQDLQALRSALNDIKQSQKLNKKQMEDIAKLERQLVIAQKSKNQGEQDKVLRQLFDRARSYGKDIGLGLERQQALGKAAVALRATGFMKSLKQTPLAAQDASNKSLSGQVPPPKRAAARRRGKQAQKQTPDPYSSTLAALSRLPFSNERASGALYNRETGKLRGEASDSSEDVLKNMSKKGISWTKVDPLLQERKRIRQDAIAKADEGKGFFGRLWGKFKRFFGGKVDENPERLADWNARARHLIGQNQNTAFKGLKMDMAGYNQRQDRLAEHHTSALAFGYAPKGAVIYGPEADRERGTRIIVEETGRDPKSNKPVVTTRVEQDQPGGIVRSWNETWTGGENKGKMENVAAQGPVAEAGSVYTAATDSAASPADIQDRVTAAAKREEERGNRPYGVRVERGDDVNVIVMSMKPDDEPTEIQIYTDDLTRKPPRKDAPASSTRGAAPALANAVNPQAPAASPKNSQAVQTNPPPQSAGFGLALLKNPELQKAMLSGAKAAINALFPGAENIASLISAFTKK